MAELTEQSLREVIEYFESLPPVKIQPDPPMRLSVEEFNYWRKVLGMPPTRKAINRELVRRYEAKYGNS